MKIITNVVSPVESGNKAAIPPAPETCCLPPRSRKSPGISCSSRWLTFPRWILLASISFSGCQGTNQSRKLVERAERERAAQKLFDTATALCKLDLLENEGVATLSANAPGAATIKKQMELENLSASYADSYVQTLKKIKKYPRQEMENEIRNLQGSLESRPRARAILPVIMRHINKEYLGMPIAAKDVSQDFQSLRYRRSIPNADNGEQ